jgi:hypothetical protein
MLGTVTITLGPSSDSADAMEMNPVNSRPNSE